MRFDMSSIDETDFFNEQMAYYIKRNLLLCPRAAWTNNREITIVLLLTGTWGLS
jgi:hypothetical protein